MKKALQLAGLVKAEEARHTPADGVRGVPIPGMMLHIDASKHRWFPDDRGTT